MDSVKLAEFLFTRIRQTIVQKRYIKEVKIGYSYGESYGNTYITVTYSLLANDDFRKLPLLDQHTMFQGSTHYIYSLSSNAQRYERYKINRIIAFKNIYESVTAYATLQLEANLLPDTAIKIDSIHLWPNVNYAEKYLSELVDRQHFYPHIDEMGTNIWQWEPLHQLALESKKELLGERRFISDLEIFESCGFSTTTTRRYIIHSRIPIKVKGLKIINLVLISVPALLHALKTNNSPDGYSFHFPGLIEYLYNNYLPDEKATIIQQKVAAYLRDFIIQIGDLIELNDNRVVQVVSVNMDAAYLIHVTYSILKSDLQLGDRTRTVNISYISSVLKAADFKEYLHNNSIKRLSLLKRWMEKRKMKVVKQQFIPDVR
ncbi:hypothetical protein F0L74_24555 [Chitinophaga agrisoli]|uniref:Uncharacterized protein n=1 Tax=Chitinophaga agrisoli TaxID=2607653 RepID=A0A5B2VLK8_9BACT|nr:hypothetical protein [Chitinophaga agrisoli]KAA2239376.1 hypothetical protein F0L74_24555 [Chitinophaga agrisoli]